jgi:hypothetical protein
MSLVEMIVHTQYPSGGQCLPYLPSPFPEEWRQLGKQAD